MLNSIDPVLLGFGAARVACWLTIAVVAYRQRRVIPLVYGTLASATSVVFAISNAHGSVPGALTDLSTFVALPIVTLILASILVTRPTTPTGRGRWHL